MTPPFHGDYGREALTPPARPANWRHLTRHASGWQLVGAICVAAFLLAMLPGSVLAHERREVGPYTFVVGFLTEPAIQGEPNGIDLRISRTSDGQPVTGAERNLKATIAFGGGQPKEFVIRSRFGVPGGYTADLIPTRAGAYIFNFTGTIEDTAVNQRFESGPGRFNDVEASEKLQFPDAIAPPAEVSSSVKALDDRVRDAEDRAQAAEEKLATVQAVGIAGVVAGLIGTVLGLVALTASRRQAAGPDGGSPALASTISQEV